MRKFKLNEKEFNCPEKWDEITLEQILKINTGLARTIEAIVICTGISEEEWNRSNDLVLIEEIEQSLSFLNDPTGCSLEKEPNKIVFKGVEVSPFSDIGTKSIAQYQDLKLLVNDFHLKEGDEVDIIRRLSLYPKVVATYLQPVIDNGEYDFNRVDELAKDLYNHSAMEVSAWGYFFIQRFIELRSGIVKDAQRLVTNQKKQRLDSLNSLKRWVGELFSIRLQAQTLRNRTR